MFRPCIGQMPRRCDRTRDYIGKGVSAFRSELAQIDDRPDSWDFIDKGQIDRTSAVDNEQKFVVMACAEADAVKL